MKSFGIGPSCGKKNAGANGAASRRPLRPRACCAAAEGAAADQQWINSGRGRGAAVRGRCKCHLGVGPSGPRGPSLRFFLASHAHKRAPHARRGRPRRRRRAGAALQPLALQLSSGCPPPATTAPREEAAAARRHDTTTPRPSGGASEPIMRAPSGARAAQRIPGRGAASPEQRSVGRGQRGRRGIGERAPVHTRAGGAPPAGPAPHREAAVVAMSMEAADALGPFLSTSLPAPAAPPPSS